jgi:hypothetical protein
MLGHFSRSVFPRFLNQNLAWTFQPYMPHALPISFFLIRSPE